VTTLARTPESLRPALTRLRRRLTLGLFLDVWPAWSAVGLVIGATAVLLCRMFVAPAAPFLPWLWLVPVLTAIPAFAVSLARTHRADQVAALADWLSGGQGLVLTMFERDDRAWSESPLVERASRLPLPHLRLARPLALLALPALFLAIALLLPQRLPNQAAEGVLAQEIAANLNAALVELKKQDLVTPEEEEELREEMERIQRSAEKRVDASSWEAADALREKVVAGLSEKQQAVKWAQDSLARYAAAVQAGGPADPSTAASAAELTKALEKLAKSGMLAGASPELAAMLKGGKFPTDAAALADLVAALGRELGDANGRFAGLGKLGQAFGRFDPSEFAISDQPSPDGDGLPGRGGLNRGRADADLTWGKETERGGKFKSKPLPPGAPRSPDDWAPVVVLPGAPQESAVLGTQSSGRQYSDAAGQGAWRRSLAPRHQSAVKKYFAPNPPKKTGGGL
jgi:hypothetical protein